jgi:8-oxo-dGTP pyrophosphatase MutT (NUDIX family)
VSEPERTLETERVYQGSRFAVRRDRVGLADGTVTHREIVEIADAVCIVPVDDDGNILLVRQYRKAVEAALLEVPAGAMEPGETPIACAKRELREETGFDAGSFQALGEFWLAPGYTNELMYAFLATKLRADALPADFDERIEVERMSVHEAVEMARSGRMHDAKSIAALLMAERLLDTRQAH